MKKLFLVPLLLVLLAGCSGDSTPSEDEIPGVIAEYAQAVGAGDWEKVCEVISIPSQQSVVDNSGRNTCAEGYKALPAAGRKQLRQSAEGTEFVSAKVEGQTAQVTVKTLGGNTVVPLLAEDGQWKVHLFK